MTILRRVHLMTDAYYRFAWLCHFSQDSFALKLSRQGSIIFMIRHVLSFDE